LGFQTSPRRALKIIVVTWALLAFAGSALGNERPADAALQLQYRLELLRPTTHLVAIEIVANKVTEPYLDFVMPAWSPGRYAIYDFAKNVQEFEAFGAEGHPLPWQKTDKQTWRVAAQDAGGEVRVQYKVFANDLNGSFSQFDTSHANLNGASIYMYVADHKPGPLTLNIAPPSGWKVISGFSLSTDQKTFEVPSYDRLIDTPMEISPDCEIRTFEMDGKTFRIAVHSYGAESGDLTRLEGDLKKVVRSEMAMMPMPDFDDYTFIIHFAPDISMGDGMEHLNSTQLILADGPSAAGIQQAIEMAAHEFFHLWNVKRLRPVALGPFDYTRENYTRSLWVTEGITTYYAYLHLLRSGVWDRSQFLQHLANEIRELQNDPGRKLMSAESSSFNAWFYDRAPQMQETNFANTTISYYNKGALLGMLLDLKICSQTAGRKSLDDVMRYLYKKFYEAPAATSYGPGRGYTEQDVLDAINTVSGGNDDAFFAHYVRGTDPLPFEKILAFAGLTLRAEAAPSSAPDLGILGAAEDRGVRIRAVIPGGPADRAGLSRDDLLIAVDDQSLATESLYGRLAIYPPGATVPFTVERHERRERISVTLGLPVADQYSIVESPGASLGQVAIREAWLRGRN
jgi:predicted metalloprotease with PDZ domain